MEKENCLTGKQMLDKKGAITLKNLTMKLHHIIMKEYECEKCGYWNLTNIDPKHRQFRHGRII